MVAFHQGFENHGDKAKRHHTLSQDRVMIMVQELQESCEDSTQ